MLVSFSQFVLDFDFFFPHYIFTCLRILKLDNRDCPFLANINIHTHIGLEPKDLIYCGHKAKLQTCEERSNPKFRRAKANLKKKKITYNIIQGQIKKLKDNFPRLILRGSIFYTGTQILKCRIIFLVNLTWLYLIYRDTYS